MLSWLNISYIFTSQTIEFSINSNLKTYIGKLTKGILKRIKNDDEDDEIIIF
jgi:hypothetical protein